ncbi:cytoplasmic protein [Neolentinus lepideus HHB14362 ss-1]|uniref:GPN-loop GTPase 2 n=1 Tax=Neolentinus lepideus HHB14362 ss-1 TaxID=1314782 RepID=A0A165MY30_9AGAM|nr:cytoplasmic protein [Neolentinus lepideus HHB14362 ss-1]
MPFGEIVCGSPGSGKSTYCYGKYQLYTALNRPVAVVNLDPANENIPYPCAIDISSLITLDDVMEEHELGPNGGMLYCMEYLETNYDWLESRLKELGNDVYILFDIPGQVELSTNHESLKSIIAKLGKSGFRIDLITQYGDLDFNLDFYTEVQDLSYLENSLSQSTPRYTALNMAVCSLIEDYGLVGFETLAVEDKHSMLHLMRVVDRAVGCVFAPPANAAGPPGIVSTSNAPSARPNEYGLFSSAIGPLQGVRSDVRDVQERWIDAKEEWDAFERTQWRREGEMVRDEAAKKSKIRERRKVV